MRNRRANGVSSRLSPRNPQTKSIDVQRQEKVDVSAQAERGNLPILHLLF